jgi:hypothetical protein
MPKNSLGITTSYLPIGNHPFTATSNTRVSKITRASIASKSMTGSTFNRSDIASG